MPDGRVFARASAHNGYAGRKRWPNLNELPGEPRLPRAGRGGVRIERRARTGAWTPIPAGPGSRAARTPATSPTDRTTMNGAPSPTASRSSRSNGCPPGDLATSFAIVPPWRKPVYADPERTDT